MNRCKEFSENMKNLIKTKVEEKDTIPMLTIIQIGDNPSSNSYIKGKVADCQEVGIIPNHKRFSEDITTAELVQEIELADAYSDGVIVQLPLPKHIDIETVQNAVSSGHDVDGFGILSHFKPCTPAGVIRYLEYEDFDFKGKIACVIGRSDIVGRPLAEMLLEKDMTVIICHSKTPRETMMQMVESADIVFTAINPIEFFDEEWFDSLNDRHIIDIGLGVNADGKLRGNIKKEVKDQLIADNPNKIIVSGVGGVGLLTRVTLLEHTLIAQEEN